MAEERFLNRRGLLTAGAAALGSLPAVFPAATQADMRPAWPIRMLSATQFGAVGDGSADDSQALQNAFDEVFRDGGGFLLIPPGTYRVSRTLRILSRHTGDIGRLSGVIAHGAQILSVIENHTNVIEVVSRTTVRFLVIEGLDILGRGKEKHGLYIECGHRDHYLYNCCLRDVVVQGCSGDGCRMVGNVFESQIINSYFRSNKGNGITFAHGKHGGILSAIHVFGCVFGNNGANGAALIRGCYDVGFHGCYFLLNGRFGLVAENGCTLLSNCGFENNHMQARDFAHGDAGITLSNFGTLIGCTGYSIFNQTRMLRADVIGQLTMVGCSGSGGGKAKDAGLALLQGAKSALATVIGCSGKVETVSGFEAIELGGTEGGVRFGSEWQSNILPCLGNYRLWVDKHGRLRMKDGIPRSDEDGTALGT